MNTRPPVSSSISQPISLPRPTEYVHHFIRSHCRYEVRTTKQGTTVTATPLTQQAKDWMAAQRVTFLQMRCSTDFAGMTVRNIECAIDTK